ncbi:hypothetical protein VTO42DRAFT_8702 [Malbranchea cinnamomea]
MRPALEQLSLLYADAACPFVAHIAAVDYHAGKHNGNRLVSDYAGALSLAEELGVGLVSSASVHEAQHMALFATLLASVVPAVHIYDGVRVGRETTRVVDVLDQRGLADAYAGVLRQTSDHAQAPGDVEARAVSLLAALNNELGTDYRPFEYHGHPEATVVLVVFGTVESSLARQIAQARAADGDQVGVVAVRVYRPFVEQAFLNVLPATTQTVAVLGQVPDDLAVQEDGVHSSLYRDVLAALTYSDRFAAVPRAVEIKYSPAQSWNTVNLAAVFRQIADQQQPQQQSPLNHGVPEDPSSILDTSAVQQYTIWDLDDAAANAAALVLAEALAKDSTANVSVSATYDNVRLGGVVRTDIRKSAKVIDAPYSVDAAATIYVGDVKFLSEVDVLASARDGASVIVRAPGLTDDDIEKKLPGAFRQALAQRGIRLFILDPSSAEADATLEPSAIVQLAVLRVAVPELEAVGIQKLASIRGQAQPLDAVAAKLETLLREIEVPESWKEEAQSDADADADTVDRATDIQPTAFGPFDKVEEEVTPVLKDWQTVAKNLAFKEAYGTRTALRPDLPTKTYTVTVKENRRLTPVTYDRNIFHIEFDLGDSGLKYDIGEALGIHAENDPDQVSDFIQHYGLNPLDIVEVPSRDDPAVYETRTVFQALVHNVDIFGKPPKRFYESLAEFATDEQEKARLLRLCSQEGAEEFKRRSEVDTVTFADILDEFPSARPSFHDLVKIVTPMKRREYSIASCQKVTPTRVALMIVVVHWVDPRGRQRWGQASHYLSQLGPGAKVTVSVKPSVMKLPPRSTQPLIMAGLGTGLAPFRAFVQHRAMEKAQGKDIGAVLLYMGSRHQREEYCYGEEWEAYQAAGVITLLGRAFSRDQPHKIYIQDRMRETLADIRKAYLHEEGYFYLCGPTWPVPDVTAVLEEAIAEEAKATGAKKVDTRREIEKLKEAERYVLEVY